MQRQLDEVWKVRSTSEPRSGKNERIRLFSANPSNPATADTKAQPHHRIRQIRAIVLDPNEVNRSRKKP